MTRSNPLLPLASSADTPPEIRELLEAGIADEVDYDYEAGLSAHLSATAALPGPPAPSPSAGAGSSAHLGATLSSKALLGVAGASLTAASILVGSWIVAGSSPPARKTSVVPAQRPLERRSADEAEAPRIAWLSGAAGLQPAADPNRDSIPGAGAPPHQAATHLAPAYRRLPGRNELSQSPLLAPASSVTKVFLQEAPPPRELPPSAVTPRAPGGTPPSTALSGQRLATGDPDEDGAAREEPPTSDERLEREMNALAEAKHALAEDPLRALELARQGNREFPRGMFREERDHILLLALIGAGRLDEAKRLAVPYLQNHPNSPFARRVQNALKAAATSAR